MISISALASQVAQDFEEKGARASDSRRSPLFAVYRPPVPAFPADCCHLLRQRRRESASSPCLNPRRNPRRRPRRHRAPPQGDDHLCSSTRQNSRHGGAWTVRIVENPERCRRLALLHLAGRRRRHSRPFGARKNRRLATGRGGRLVAKPARQRASGQPNRRLGWPTLLPPGGRLSFLPRQVWHPSGRRPPSRLRRERFL